MKRRENHSEAECLCSCRLEELGWVDVAGSVSRNASRNASRESQFSGSASGQRPQDREGVAGAKRIEYSCLVSG